VTGKGYARVQGRAGLKAELRALRQQVKVLERRIKRSRWQPEDRLSSRMPSAMGSASPSLLVIDDGADNAVDMKRSWRLPTIQRQIPEPHYRQPWF
jgi:hypothetical protein